MKLEDIEEILFDEQAIKEKVRELAASIAKDYAGKELVLVCILKGAAVFTADLMRHLSMKVTIEYIQAASYGSSTISSRAIIIKKDLESDIRGKDVLLVDTIIDTGATLERLFSLLRERGPASLNAVVLLDKKSRRASGVRFAYRGFEIADRFVVGYGMDFGEKYRNLPYIAALRSDAK
ncbi:MAG TPA: hypoxanthine phosphoribosyltransferase [Nitrospirota bacterium]